MTCVLASMAELRDSEKWAAAPSPQLPAAGLRVAITVPRLDSFVRVQTAKRS